MQAEHNGFWVLNTRGEVVFSTHTEAAAQRPRRSWVAAVYDALTDAPHCSLLLPTDGVELEAWRMLSATGADDPEGPAIALCVRPAASTATPLPDSPDPLFADASMTPRQTEVSEYAASGATVGEIASHLGISTETVRSHLKNVYRNLGVANRVELARAMGQLHALSA
ncbi:MAG: hypothetical protein H6726_19065 [Sandaracinaceae bacterium]|nr:hypothetical protein [Sandaracinaceae bacterium]